MQEIIYSLEKQIELADETKRLLNQPDFIKVVMNEYLQNHALKLTYELANYPVGLDTNNNLVNELNAISLFNAYLFGLIEQGQVAFNEIENLKQIPVSEYE